MIKELTEFYTVHKPKNHSAYHLNGKPISVGNKTEIELARNLPKLKDFEYFNNRGDVNFLVVNWKKIKH